MKWESLLIWPLRVEQNFTLSGIKPYKQEDDLFFCFINKQSILAPPPDLGLSYSYCNSKQFNDYDDDGDGDDDDDELFLWDGWPTKGV